jgi:hypothetical protein
MARRRSASSGTDAPPSGRIGHADLSRSHYWWCTWLVAYRRASAWRRRNTKNRLANSDCRGRRVRVNRCGGRAGCRSHFRLVRVVPKIRDRIMMFAAYMPSWEGAARALPAQCLVLGMLAVALFVYARQRHGAWRSAFGLAIGLLAGAGAGLGWVWSSWIFSVPFPALSRAEQFNWGTIEFFELGHSAVAGALGLLQGGYRSRVLGCINGARLIRDFPKCSLANPPERGSAIVVRFLDKTG